MSDRTGIWSVKNLRLTGFVSKQLEKDNQRELANRSYLKRRPLLVVVVVIC